jgi:phage tail sheath protein FI
MDFGIVELNIERSEWGARTLSLPQLLNMGNVERVAMTRRRAVHAVRTTFDPRKARGR